MSVVNGTATTEIYTVCHTCALHDALPVFQAMAQSRVLDFVERGQDPVRHPGPALDQHRVRVGQLTTRLVGEEEEHLGPAADVLGLLGERSEEHTSELQSLMRISYAVFCLNNKTATISHLHNHTASY